MITRSISDKIKLLSGQFPIVTLTGPRQSGKSTLLRSLFPEYQYVSLENIDMREFAQTDPRGFLATYPDKVILDEVQRVPSLLSYLQTHIDVAGGTGMYLLAGSQNFLLMQGIDQSLAGRTALLKLLPLSRAELNGAGLLPQAIDEQIFTGFYPRIYDKGISPTDFYPAYVQTYVERDVRTLNQIRDLGLFHKFVRLAAGRIGQLLNMTSLAVECGISPSTAESWLTLLEASYICYRLEPNHNNYSKRIVKTPKLYFYDTGLACSLLGLTSASQVEAHFMRGALFENLVINQFVKDAYNRGENPDLTFWRDSAGNEVDLIVSRSGRMEAYEIKSGATFHRSYFGGISKWGRISGTPAQRLNVIYGGDVAMKTSEGNVLAFPAVF